MPPPSPDELGAPHTAVHRLELVGPRFRVVRRLRRVLTAVVGSAVVAVVIVPFTHREADLATRAIQVAWAVVASSVGLWALYWAANRAVDLVGLRAAERVRPFVFVGPALAVLGLYLVYPALNTLALSFQDADSERWVGLGNYRTILTENHYLTGLRNSLLWVAVVPLAVVVIGLGFATMADAVTRRAEAVAKSLIFLPMAISFVGAVVVWTFVYAFRPAGFGEQIGVMNAVWTGWPGGDPVNWLAQRPWNNLYLMVILVWLETGFAMVILSSAIKAVPDELVEAARIDGANEWQVFRRIVLPSISSTVLVVWTTELITVWKVFDIVWVTTGGRDGTQIVAQQMVEEFFTFDDNGVGAALAVVMFAAVVPILAINIHRFRTQERER